AVFAQSKAPAKKPWTQTRTPDGQPDIQGIWTNPTLTPFERPEELGSKATFTEQEVREIEERAAKSRVDRAPKAGDTGAYNVAWNDGGTKLVSTRQKSIVVDPPTGRIAVKPLAEAKRMARLASVHARWRH